MAKSGKRVQIASSRTKGRTLRKRVRGSARELDKPSTRPLKAYAFDPSQGRRLGNKMDLAVRYQELDAGPAVRDHRTWDGVAVIDYDATNNVYYEPVDLDDPRVLIRGGLDPLDSDPRFHQQMVYAVATDTIQHFEAALGRRIHWRRSLRDRNTGEPDESIYILNLFPHAMVMANAFYTPRAHGILFGYFRANETNQGRNLPGQVVYTCLSQDVIVHEVTHAIVDGIRGHFMEQTNPDVAAFHEAFADIVALFRHFSHQEAILDTIQRTGGALFQAQLAPLAPATGATALISAQLPGQNPLVELARQFGEATGHGRALRAALETPPNSDAIKNTFECHARGAILVSAIFDAFFTIYVQRTADLFRIFRNGGGSTSGEVPASLARLLAEQASRTANLFFTVCVRSLDYCPPVDITFGDFLRAVITADFDLYPSDDLGLRDAFMQAFRVRGITAEGSDFFTEVSIAWPAAKGYPQVENLVFGDPNGLTSMQQDACRHALQKYFDTPEVRRRIGFDPQLKVEIPSFHPMFRMNQDGTLRTDMVVEATQERPAAFDPQTPELGDFPMRGGATFIISKPDHVQRRDYGLVRFVIPKHLHGEDGAFREARQRKHYQSLGLVEGSDPDRFQIDFGLTHGGF